MNEAEKNIELTAEAIEDVTGGYNSEAEKKNHMKKRFSNWEPAPYVACPFCDDYRNVFRMVKINEFPDDTTYSDTFLCKKCDKTFIQKMIF